MMSSAPLNTIQSASPSAGVQRRVAGRVWAFRGLMGLLLFGVSSLTYGSNQLHPLLALTANLAGVAGATALLLGYFEYPTAYKWVAWVLSLAIFGLILESLHVYRQYVYSFFVIKRLAYCGLALITYLVARRAGPLRLSWVMLIIGGLYVFGQLILGKIFQYSFTSETRTTSAYDSYYLLLPLLFFLLRYRQQHRYADLLGGVFTFGVIVLLLHRSVISSALFAVGIVFALAMAGKLERGRFPMSRTLTTLLLLGIGTIPFLSILSPARTEAFLDNIGGIASPTEDNTGNWRYEQSLYYWSKIPERLWLGWRYEGYDRGEVMANEDFPAKGTIIHSQYVDMLYNYGLAGLLLNLFVIGSTLWLMHRHSPTFSLDQTVLFAFIASGLLFGVSYQLPIYYWSFVGLGLYSTRRQNATGRTPHSSPSALVTTASPLRSSPSFPYV